MNIVFMGTPDFSIPSLEILLDNGFNVVTVVTAPDHYGGRGGKQLLESPIKKFAISKGLPVLQPIKLRNPEFIKALQTLNADLQIVVAFRMLPEIVWNMPRLGTINLHGSLLPKFRGAAPINWAVIRGETETGVTCFKLKHDIDTGDIISQAKFSILPYDNASNVHDRMMHVGAQLVLKTVKDMAAGPITFQIQDESGVSNAPKLFHEDCKIDFNQDAKAIHNFIRGLSHYPLAHTMIDGKEVKIDQASYEETLDNLGVEPGTIITDHKKKLSIACSNGVINILKLKMEGKKLMTSQELLNGYKIVDFRINK